MSNENFNHEAIRLAMCIELDREITRAATEAARDLSGEDFEVVVAWLKREMLKKVIEAMTPEQRLMYLPTTVSVS